MMDFLFLLSWTALFTMGALLIWRKIVPRSRVYFLLALNFVFLAGVFCFYDIWGRL